MGEGASNLAPLRPREGGEGRRLPPKAPLPAAKLFSQHGDSAGRNLSCGAASKGAISQRARKNLVAA